MEPYVLYILVFTLVIGDVIAVQAINKSRRKLDLSKTEDAAKDAKLKLAIPMILAQSLVVAAFLLYLF